MSVKSKVPAEAKSPISRVALFTVTLHLLDGNEVLIRKGTIESCSDFSEILLPGDEKVTHVRTTVLTATREYIVSETPWDIWKQEAE